MVLKGVSSLSGDAAPLSFEEVPEPSPKEGEILLKVAACGVCHTELDEIEGRTPPPFYPVILGHQVVGRVAARGAGAHRFPLGARVGVGWINRACGLCPACLSGRENLCPSFKATGRDSNGGYAEFMTVDERYAHPIPPLFSDSEAAPLLCAGAIGWRSLRLTDLRDGQNLGLAGFGASGHLVLTMAKHLFPGVRVFVFARSEKQRDFARSLGAFWCGDIDDQPPEMLDAVIDTTPAWRPVVRSLRSLAPAGRLVINAIRKEEGDKEELLSLEYPAHLWLEKEIKSVANVTRKDIEEFLALAAEIPIRPSVETYLLAEANRALADLKAGSGRGAKVLLVS